MTNEESIKSQLEGKFEFLKDKIKVTRERRLFSEYLSQEEFLSVFAFAVKNLQFAHLCTISGVDEIENFGFVYHLARQDGIVFSLKTSVPKDKAVIKSIGEYFPGGIIYEREIEDLLGVKVEGLPPGERYPLPDGWPAGQYPLRKDWNPEVLNEAKNPLATNKEGDG